MGRCASSLRDAGAWRPPIEVPKVTTFAARARERSALPSGRFATRGCVADSGGGWPGLQRRCDNDQRNTRHEHCPGVFPGKTTRKSGFRRPDRWLLRCVLRGTASARRRATSPLPTHDVHERTHRRPRPRILRAGASSALSSPAGESEAEHRTGFARRELAVITCCRRKLAGWRQTGRLPAAASRRPIRPLLMRSSWLPLTTTRESGAALRMTHWHRGRDGGRNHAIGRDGAAKRWSGGANTRLRWARSLLRCGPTAAGGYAPFLVSLASKPS